MSAPANGEKFEPEVQREMIVPLLRPPDREKLIPVFRGEDLVDFDKRDRRMLEEISILHQENAWQKDALVESNSYLRRLEAENIRLRLRYDRAQQEQTEDRLAIKILKWIANVGGAGIIAAAALKLMKS